MTQQDPQPVSPEADAKPAAQYIRMSTEHQQYSTENQADVIREYAQKRGRKIVKTYADEGKSGLSLQGRHALRKMIEDVRAGQSDYEEILVYDVSRWGRFQDSDESAYYEYICKRAGVQVSYCAEQFENDGSPASTIIKSVKRAMAGEYSRKLSTLVCAGQCKLIELGYRQGGPPGFGLRRMLLDMEGKPKGELKRGEQKSLQTDRVILVPGPEEEVGVIRPNNGGHLTVNGEYTAALVLSRCRQYGQNMLNLVVVVGYLRNLLNNAALVRFLSQAEATMLAEFQKIVDHEDMQATG